LSTNYLNDAISHNNPVIIKCIKEYKRYKGGRVIEIPTLLDEFLEQRNDSEIPQVTGDQIEVLEQLFNPVVT
jgi:hypothetical protein